MVSRKSATKIDPIQVCVLALKRVRTRQDYNRIAQANTEADIKEAWATLTSEEQQRINNICGATPQPDLQAIASELTSCGTLIQLQAVKAEHGEGVVRQAWRLIPAEERLRLKGICQTEQQQAVEEILLVVEKPASVEPQQSRRSLFNISSDLEHLNDLLDEVGDDAQQQELINNWFEHLGHERDRKLDGYAALISEMTARAEVRKAEAKRMQELAASDDNRARLLKERLKWFFETHGLKTVETPRYKLQLQRNGGRAPLILDENVPVTSLPEHFQKVSIDADTTAIREALEKGESLEWARLGERGNSIRIK